MAKSENNVISTTTPKLQTPVVHMKHAINLLSKRNFGKNHKMVIAAAEQTKCSAAQKFEMNEIC